MKRRCFLLLSLLLIGAAFSGCANNSKTPAITHDVEDSFRARWVAKRQAEILAAGQVTDPREARVIAADEFRKKYEYTGAAQKGDPVKGTPP